MIEFLDDQHILNESVVTLISDQGDSQGEHDLFGHIPSLYEQVIHVPMLMLFPHTYKIATRYDFPVEIIDLIPTILHLADWRGKYEGHGKNLLDLLNYPDEDRMVFAERYEVGSLMLKKLLEINPNYKKANWLNQEQKCIRSFRY